MKRVLNYIAALLIGMCCYMLAIAQSNITNAEYFFDNDPGFGNGSAISITSPAANITSLAFNANVSSLSNGMHTLFVRSKDANGIWSVTNNMYIAKVQSLSGNNNTASNIVSAEYFFDNDPGFGNGNNITLTPANQISSLAFSANVAALTNGMHTLYVRTKEAQGKWSFTQNYYFVKVQSLSGNNNTASNIVSGEYFFDTDPGFGNGNSISVTPASQISSLAFSTNVSSIAMGMHTLYVRMKDAQGKWSITQNYYFVKVQNLQGNTNSISKITKLEYFFNADPGFGNGVNVPITAATDINNFMFNASVSTLPTGLHTVYVRAMDSLGKWSITSSFQFSRIQGLSPNANQLSRINKAEYFYDTDPGYGNGTDVPIGPSYDVNGLTFNTSVSSLANGVHTLYVRTRDSLGQWSETSNFYFTKIQGLSANPHSFSRINKLEYFFDSDPGYGNGTNVPITTSYDISNFSLTANVSSIPNGVHTLYVRSRDSLGQWSIVYNVTFAKVQSLSTNPNTLSNITQIEYFLDTDPGFGNGTQVTGYTSGQTVSSVSFNVDLTYVVNGPHILYVRTKDQLGKWSITQTFAFNGGIIPTPITLVSFDATLQQDESVLLEWITDMELNVKNYFVERSNDAQSWTLVGEKKPASPNSKTRIKYQLTDEHPGKGIIYYRLTEVDMNGDKNIAPIRFVRIDDYDYEASSVYPNPNDGEVVNIQSSLLKNGAVEISIISTDGKLYLKQKVQSNGSSVYTLSSLHLPAATYYINLRQADKTESLKLIVAQGNL